MSRAAAQHSLSTKHELRKEVAELRATVAGLERRLQQQDKQQREVAALQATVAAMGAQLQALQNSMQQG